MSIDEMEVNLEDPGRHCLTANIPRTAVTYFSEVSDSAMLTRTLKQSYKVSPINRRLISNWRTAHTMGTPHPSARKVQ